MQRLVSHTERWRYEYRGVVFEISKRDRVPTPFWAYYIYIPLDIMPTSLREKFWLTPTRVNGKIMWGLQENTFLNKEMFWHAGGPDYYKKIGGHDDTPKLVKIGCGFGGDWEKHIEYGRENLDWEACLTIDSFTKLVLGWPNRHD